MQDGATTTELCRVAVEMAKGVAHLHEHGFLHRDVALRNFLVGHDSSIRICDFGLSRQVDDSIDAYYALVAQSALPIRWMAPEALLTLKSTRASDVWMFGVTIWELFSGGSEEPYSGQAETFNQVICGVCTGALRLVQPSICPNPVWSIVQTCCDLKPERRPTMQDVVRRLEGVDVRPRSKPTLAATDT